VKQGIFILFCLIITAATFAQDKSGMPAKWLQLLSANDEVQITGANSPALPPTIYLIKLLARKTFRIYGVTTMLHGAKLYGKIRYNHTISDSIEIYRNTSFTLQFETNPPLPAVEGSPKDEKNLHARIRSIAKSPHLLITLLLDNHRVQFIVHCVEKKISTPLQLPQ
jgi:hypothetical protein